MDEAVAVFEPKFRILRSHRQQVLYKPMFEMCIPFEVRPMPFYFSGNHRKA